MSALCRAVDWAVTSLGPVAQWPISLRTAAQIVLAAPFPTILLWGKELIQLYNDGYRDLMSNKHPAGLGQPTRQCWPEVWHINQPIYQRVWARESCLFLARSYGGLGLGLALVQQLVQLHGGRVEAHSLGLEEGSEFVVHLPILIA